MPLILSEKINEARVLASQKVSDTTLPYNSDEEITPIFQRKFNKLYYMLVEKAENYFVREINFNRVESDQDLFLNDNIYKIIDVSISRDGRDFYSLKKRDLVTAGRRDVRGGFVNDLSYGIYPSWIESYYWVLVGDRIRIVPEDRQVFDFKITYVPEAPRITDVFMVDRNDADEKTDLTIPKGYYDWLVYSVALELLITKEDEAGDIMREADRIWGDILSWAEDRSISEPDKIRLTDTDYRRGRYGYYYG